MLSNRKLLLLLIFTIPLLAIFWQCNIFSSAPPPDPRGPLYAGSSTCINCHKEVYTDFLHTAHFGTTRLAAENSISGSFKPGSNTFTFNSGIKVVMEKRDSGLYQVAYQNGQAISAQRFGITVGGIKAESYLYWQAGKLYQLPMSYFKSLHSWTNSPGYDSTFADFTRSITVGCLQCHASYIKPIAEQTVNGQTSTDFDKSSLIMGIDCERCHGSAADHVYYQTTHPEDKTAQHIITYASLTRAQKVNMCAVCHSGTMGTVLHSTFTYKPNDNLNDYKIEALFQSTDPAHLDVHANQPKLLAGSKCYINSNMACATCHNVHSNERQQLAMYSQKCMNCHTAATHNFCPEAPKIGAIIKNNCIDCHMPARPSNIISVGTSGHQGKVSPYLVRSHYIAIYADATQAVLTNLKKTGKLAVR
jgi:hypothetical protein